MKDPKKKSLLTRYNEKQVEMDSTEEVELDFFDFQSLTNEFGGQQPIDLSEGDDLDVEYS